MGTDAVPVVVDTGTSVFMREFLARHPDALTQVSQGAHRRRQFGTDTLIVLQEFEDGRLEVFAGPRLALASLLSGPITSKLTEPAPTDCLYVVVLMPGGRAFMALLEHHHDPVFN